MKHPRLRHQLFLFWVAGTIGFIVDAGVVQLLVSKAGANPYIARLFSFLCAATATWVFNRRYTFHGRPGYGLFGEWSRYIAAMCIGFAVNYTVYALIVYDSAFVHDWPSIGVAAGSLPGAAFNFLSARLWVFRHAKPAAPAPRDEPEKLT